MSQEPSPTDTIPENIPNKDVMPNIEQKPELKTLTLCHDLGCLKLAHSFASDALKSTQTKEN